MNNYLKLWRECRMASSSLGITPILTILPLSSHESPLVSCSYKGLPTCSSLGLEGDALEVLFKAEHTTVTYY